MQVHVHQSWHDELAGRVNGLVHGCIRPLSPLRPDVLDAVSAEDHVTAPEVDVPAAVKGDYAAAAHERAKL
jgi:hypothetical protein